MNARYAFFRIFHKVVMRPVARWTRGMTMGARTAVIDGQGRVLLVKQSYAPGWILPGGGVERGETCETAALRELHEEAAVTPRGPLQIHGVFSNHASFPGDHLVIYTLREFEWNGFTPTAEIVAAAFFHMDDLPEDVMPSTRRRIDEFAGRAPITGEW